MQDEGDWVLTSQPCSRYETPLACLVTSRQLLGQCSQPVKLQNNAIVSSREQSWGEEKETEITTQVLCAIVYDLY